MITPYVIDNSSWTKITGPGRSAKVFIDYDSDDAEGKADIRIYHGETAPSLSDITDSPRVFRVNDNINFFEATPDSELDEFYAIAVNDGDKARLIVDEIGGTAKAPGYRDIYIQDQISDPLEFYISRKIDTAQSITANIPVIDQGDFYEVQETTTITLTSAASAAIGLWIEIWEGPFKHQSEISNVVGNNVTLLNPIGKPFTTSATVYIVDVDQNKNFAKCFGDNSCHS